VVARRRTSDTSTSLPVRRSPDLRSLAPSRASVAVGLALLVLGAVAYVGARETSVFAVQQLRVEGGTARVQTEVRAALEPLVGRSLLDVDAAAVQRSLEDVADVRSASFDRAFPHTLAVKVTPERPVLLLRRASDAWVVSSRGRVLRAVANPRLSSLPRVWVGRHASVVPGALLKEEDGAGAALALDTIAATRFPARLRYVRSTSGELTLVLRTGTEIRLGDPGDLRLKLAIARRILAAAGADVVGGYADVSVPERPVVGALDSQVAG